MLRTARPVIKRWGHVCYGILYNFDTRYSSMKDAPPGGPDGESRISSDEGSRGWLGLGPEPVLRAFRKKTFLPLAHARGHRV